MPIEQYPRTYGNGLTVKLRSAPVRMGAETRAALQRIMPSGSYPLAQDRATIVANQRSSSRMGAAISPGSPSSRSWWQVSDGMAP